LELKFGLAAVSNFPAFLAALEGYSQPVSGGGSISMRLFQNETLTDVHVEGSGAWGTRVSTGRDPAKMSSSCSARASGTSS
jgi:hypothetical protein